MIDIKTDKEIAIMTRCGHMLANVLFQVMDAIKPGVSELEIEGLAERLIREKGGEPGFQRVQGYKYATCISTNDVVVHGIPTAYVIQPGDLVGVDCGVYLDGFHTDMAESVLVPGGKRDNDIELFLSTGKKALQAGIAQATVGNRIGHISKAIQDIVEGQGGYSIVRSLIGHGVGRELHEEPEVPGFLNGKIENTVPLVPGMTIAVEIIYNMGKHDVVYKNRDGWTISTKDKTLSGLFERTILVSKDGPVILTK